MFIQLFVPGAGKVAMLRVSRGYVYSIMIMEGWEEENEDWGIWIEETKFG